jgi:hypothetical protein
VCDEPHPLLIKDMLDHCVKADIDEAYKAGSGGLLLPLYVVISDSKFYDWLLSQESPA